MKHAVPLFAPIVLGLSMPACAMLAPATTSSPFASSAQPVATKDAQHSEVRASDTRNIGDFRVHRFSGSYQKAPLTLTQEVIGREQDAWVIDYTFEEQSGATKLRVRFDPKTDSVQRVSKIDGGRELPVPTSTYENLIERTSFAADSNEGMLSASRGTCLVGPSELECETKSYQVAVGDKPAVLNVSRSNSLPGEDVAGDIIGGDGSVIYRSELLEIGNVAAPKHGVASR